MKILQINSSINSGSTGRITEQIGAVALEKGHQSYIAFGRTENSSKSVKIKIGGICNVFLHFLESFLFDRHAFSSRIATYFFLRKVDKIAPDIIALYNLHGYYLNVEMLFKYIKAKNIPVVWTLFDCWAFTGHCSYFDNINCEKWKSHCEKCPKSSYYPRSFILDNSKRNFSAKKTIFNNVENMKIVVHSEWLKTMVSCSILNKYKVNVIPSGVDVSVFKPQKSGLKQKLKLDNKTIILGCASIWDKRKGLDDFIQLSVLLPDNFQIVLIGLSNKQLKQVDKKIIGISRTENIAQLVDFYNLADVFVNPTYQDNFPTTNLEALACGTPVITYNTGGSPEAIDTNTGFVVEKGDIQGIYDAIMKISELKSDFYIDNCRKRAVEYFDNTKTFAQYVRIFEDMFQKSVK